MEPTGAGAPLRRPSRDRRALRACPFAPADRWPTPSPTTSGSRHEQLDAGTAVEDARRDFRAFLGRGSMVAGWGTFSARLLDRRGISRGAAARPASAPHPAGARPGRRPSSRAFRRARHWGRGARAVGWGRWPACSRCSLPRRRAPPSPSGASRRAEGLRAAGVGVPGAAALPGDVGRPAVGARRSRSPGGGPRRGHGAPRRAARKAGASRPCGRARGGDACGVRPRRGRAPGLASVAATAEATGLVEVRGRPGAPRRCGALGAARPGGRRGGPAPRPRRRRRGGGSGAAGHALHARCGSPARRGEPAGTRP